MSVMSALGQTQTFAAQNGMSALPPISTSIAFLPKAFQEEKPDTLHGVLFVNIGALLFC